MAFMGAWLYYHEIREISSDRDHQCIWLYIYSRRILYLELKIRSILAIIPHGTSFYKS
jgi:hypothetical protein